MSSGPQQQPPDPTAFSPPARRVDVRSRFVHAATRGAFVVGVALSLFPLAWEGYSLLRQAFTGPITPPGLGEVFEAALFGFLLGPLLSWLVLMPVAGRLAAWLESLVVPIYRAVVWKPERFEEIYGKPLPGSALPKSKANPGGRGVDRSS